MTTRRRPSQATFRRRRIVALLVVITPILLVARACTGGDSAPAATVAPSASATARPTATASASASAAASASARATSASASPSASATPTPTLTATPELRDCPNSRLVVTVTTDAPTYKVGDRVTLSMRIGQTGDTPCKRDIGALANEIYVTDTNNLVVWSSDACQADAKMQVVTLKPGAVYGNTQVWNGANTGRDCSSLSPDATAGTYRAFARNDTVVSKPYTFTIA